MKKEFLSAVMCTVLAAGGCSSERGHNEPEPSSSALLGSLTVRNSTEHNIPVSTRPDYNDLSNTLGWLKPGQVALAHCKVTDDYPKNTAVYADVLGDGISGYIGVYGGATKTEEGQQHLTPGLAVINQLSECP